MVRDGGARLSLSGEVVPSSSQLFRDWDLPISWAGVHVSGRALELESSQGKRKLSFCEASSICLV